MTPLRLALPLLLAALLAAAPAWAGAQREEEMRVISDWNAWLHEQARKVDYLSAEAPPDMGAGADEE